MHKAMDWVLTSFLSSHFASNECSLHLQWVLTSRAHFTCSECSFHLQWVFISLAVSTHFTCSEYPLRLQWVLTSCAHFTCNECSLLLQWVFTSFAVSTHFLAVSTNFTCSEWFYYRSNTMNFIVFSVVTAQTTIVSSKKHDKEIRDCSHCVLNNSDQNSVKHN